MLFLSVGDHLPIAHVSARGLWDRFAPPDSFDAYYRAYQWQVPCFVRLDSANSEKLADFLQSCVAWPRKIRTNTVDFIFIFADEKIRDRILQIHGKLITEYFPNSLYLILNTGEKITRAIYSVSNDSLWGHHCELNSWLDNISGVVDWLKSSSDRRVIFDSTDTETTIADMHPDGAEQDTLMVRRCSENGIEVWRRGDLLEGDALHTASP
jgi:hypothetical protein